MAVTPVTLFGFYVENGCRCVQSLDVMCKEKEEAEAAHDNSVLRCHETVEVSAVSGLGCVTGLRRWSAMVLQPPRGTPSHPR